MILRTSNSKVHLNLTHKYEYTNFELKRIIQRLASIVLLLPFYFHEIVER